ncbi:hypothetical protein JMJ77_0003384 [Colletotrichum scovillei]|uniref:Uncharacterized protein n=1 Tax=Colletotrichum scovillei TaxID=1209932 RepID=A0A9P7UBA3_9PEZI|nr:hypothetical protein JMJ78_0004893 [Colletotrichum scovillei]KAG7041277.1 hypothetical protein JMJ77_0003384 [Colletotrichum scovillei]KAG7061307.1 hypothetical protein JMJ76_0000872 [Colletotrichum scovillei]
MRFNFASVAVTALAFFSQ